MSDVKTPFVKRGNCKKHISSCSNGKLVVWPWDIKVNKLSRTLYNCTRVVKIDPWIEYITS